VKENGTFHLPGGGMDLGEDPKETVMREVLEETGIVVTNPKLIDVNSSFFTWETIEQSQVFTHVHALLLYYSCDYSGGNLGDVSLDEYEELAGLTAEWVETSKLDTIVIGTTVNWLPIVKQIIG
jgi:8-oxo-dGTP pyrophosphatase MutT (NUDIX family)